MRKRDLFILILAIAAAILVAFTVFRGSALQTGSWGLSFRQEGAAPIGNAGVDQLKQYDAAYIGDTTKKVLYLTFDAGYENGCTEKILDTLKKHDIKAAFFLVGNYIEKNADLVRRLVEEAKFPTRPLSPRNCRIWKACTGKSQGRRCRNTTGRPRGRTARKT